MKTQGLREKDGIVLRAIVESYLKLGRPVSSGTIHQRRLLSDSPATIRNTMVRLTEMGFLAQPHTSAGRVPTDMGLRFYVNSLLAGSPLPVDLMGFLGEDHSVQKGDLNTLLHQASRLLAERSDSLSFVIQPRLSKTYFHHLRFIKIAGAKVMIILVTAFNLVLTEIVTTDADFDQDELDRASQYLNGHMRGKTLLAARDILLRDLGATTSKFERAFGRVTALLKASIAQEDQEETIIVQGASKLIGKFGSSDLAKLRSLFQNIEEKANLAKLLSDLIALDRVKVLIGSESNLPVIADCALVLSHYGDRSQVLGSLGIIGPKRIPYGRIIPLVDNVAQKLSRTISQNL